MSEKTMFPEVSEEEVVEYNAALMKALKKSLPNPIFKTIPVTGIGKEVYLLHNFQQNNNILLDVSIHESAKHKDIDIYIISVAYDCSEICDDAYAISKDVKFCSEEVIHPEFYEAITKYIKEGCGLHTYKSVSGKDNGYTYFYIYKHDVTQLFINVVEQCTDLVTREYLTGKLLGYSEEAMHEHLTRFAKDQISKYNGYFPDNFSYMDLVSRCNVVDVQDDWIIRTDCLVDFDESENE